ncbi:hypothetical protein [Zooshikella harenae]|uniref:Preprotein translocase subunit YajC n=1 Tax=Zooshikella harenae TaxID=2827238 RepID=A0ABS5ZAY9_9GAMM|nr:hypothetical protein [Zooshikella harenae]MBU2711227.1 hypothetical protein [Zooshikella harenae]
MTYLIILLGVLAIVGSLMWILPSPADRKRMVLRQLAIAKGIEVRQTLYKDRKGKSITCIGYICRIVRPKGNIEIIIQHDTDRPQQWTGWPDESGDNRLQPHWSTLQKMVESLPDDVVQVSITSAYISVLWLEKGMEEELNNIITFLHQIKDWLEPSR